MKSALALINNIRKKDRPKRNGFRYGSSRNKIKVATPLNNNTSEQPK